MNKDNIMKKSNKINDEKKGARKPRLSKEEREARKLKLQEERAAKKAAAKAKREERKAKRLARLQAEKERKAAQKLKAKERAEAKKAREAALLEKKAAHEAKKAERQNQAEKKVKNEPEVKKVSIQDKIEAERNEWKALSAIRRYVKSNAKILEELDGNKLARKIKKLQKMGYTIDVENGTPISIGYGFEIGVRIKAAKPAPEKKERKPRKPHAEKIEEVQQPQDSVVVVEPEKPSAEAEEKLLTDDEILEAAKQDTEAQPVEVLAGDTFKDESEIAEDDNLKNSDNDDEELDDDDDDEDSDDEDDDILRRDDNISDEQADYRHDAFREMEENGIWD